MKKSLLVLLAMVFILDVPVFAQSNYVKSKDNEEIIDACVLNGHKSLIGKTFVGLSENEIYHEISILRKQIVRYRAFGSSSELDNPLGDSFAFALRKPERFTITGFLTSGRLYFFRIMFDSGKEAYISEGDLDNQYKVIVSIEDLKVDDYLWGKRKDHPNMLIGKIEAECEGKIEPWHIEKWKEWEQQKKNDLEEAAKSNPSIKNWSGYKSWRK